jgi:hypothetical protein
MIHVMDFSYGVYYLDDYLVSSEIMGMKKILQELVYFHDYHVLCF